jgi:organic radical activating enzyme
VEGEGRTLGAATFLVRLSGCDLRCWWCDSKQSSFREDEAQALPWGQVLAEAKASRAPWLSLTGGEPTWRTAAELKSLAALCRGARRSGMKVKLESNGRRVPPELDGLVDLWSVAPKSDSQARAQTALMHHDLPALKRLVRRCAPQGLQLKFVICYDRLQPRAWDLQQAVALLKRLPAAVKRTPAFFIPEAYAAGDYSARCRALEAELPGLLKRLPGHDLRVQPQWHRVLYGEARGR